MGGMPVAPNYVQAGFRGRDNVLNPSGINTAFDGGDSAKNANFTIEADLVFRVRFQIQNTETNSNNHANIATEFALQYNYDAGGWTPVPAQGDNTEPVQYADGDFADGDNTTQLISAAQFITGDGVEVTPSDTITFSTSPGVVEDTELEFALEIVSGQVADAKTFQLRVIFSDEDESPPATVLASYDETPTVTVDLPAAPVNVDVPLAVLNLTGYVPTIQTPRNVDAPTGVLNLTGHVPTVEVTENVNVAVPLGVLNLTGYVPTIQTPRNVDVPLATLTVTGYAPTIGIGVNIQVPAGVLTLTGYTPTIAVTEHIDIEIPAAALALTGYSPTVTTTANVDIEVPVAAVTLTGYAPTIDVSVGGNINIEVPAGALILTGYAPTVVGTPSAVVVPVIGGSLKPLDLPMVGDELRPVWDDDEEIVLIND